jgi:hypothetical protein
MANVFTTAMDNLGNWIAGKIAGYINDPLDKRYGLLEDYYNGDHRRTLKVEQGKRDDNVLLNYVGLAVDRSTSRLFSGGVQFQLPEGAEAQQEYIDKVWDLNKREILLFQAGLYGAVFGTPALKIVPDDITDKYTGKLYPRLVCVYPRYLRIKTDPQNMDKVLEYQIAYSVTSNGLTVEYREIMRSENETWVVEYYEKRGMAMEQLVNVVNWDYDFPPVLHWKNLPSMNNVLGDSEIDDAILTNDHVNFTVSNMSKIIKYHAAPKGTIFGVNADQVTAVDSAVGNMLVIPNKDAKMQMIEMESDLASSRNLAQDLQSAVFAQAREVDISMMADKLGALTNFGLRVLYTDALQKNNTKRQLYGDAIKEINRRLLVLANWTMEQSDPGEVVWGSDMPLNFMEEITADKLAIEMGIVDPQTVAMRSIYVDRYGADWETIQAQRQALTPAPIEEPQDMTPIEEPEEPEAEPLPPPTINVNMPAITLNTQMPQQGSVTVNMPENPAPDIVVNVPQQTPPVVNISNETPVNNITVQPANVVMESAKEAEITTDDNGTKKIKVTR